MLKTTAVRSRPSPRVCARSWRPVQSIATHFPIILLDVNLVAEVAWTPEFYLTGKLPGEPAPRSSKGMTFVTLETANYIDVGGLLAQSEGWTMPVSGVYYGDSRKQRTA